jgi:hypothetical protein
MRCCPPVCAHHRESHRCHTPSCHPRAVLSFLMHPVVPTTAPERMRCCCAIASCHNAHYKRLADKPSVARHRQPRAPPKCRSIHSCVHRPPALPPFGARPLPRGHRCTTYGPAPRSDTRTTTRTAARPVPFARCHCALSALPQLQCVCTRSHRGVLAPCHTMH